MKLTLGGIVFIPTTGKKGTLLSSEQGEGVVEYEDGTMERVPLAFLRPRRAPRPFGTKAQYATGSAAPGGTITGYWVVRKKTGAELSFHLTRNQALYEARRCNLHEEEENPSC